MALLLERKGLANDMIQEEVVHAATSNLGTGTAILKLLLDQKNIDILITKDIVKAAAENPLNGKAIIMLILVQRDIQALVSEEAVVEIVSRFDGEVMMLLLESLWDVAISKEIVRAAARNWNSGKAVMSILLNHQGTLHLTETIMAEIVKLFSESIFLNQI
jgi:hypothetical protein